MLTSEEVSPRLNLSVLRTGFTVLNLALFPACLPCAPYRLCNTCLPIPGTLQDPLNRIQRVWQYKGEGKGKVHTQTGHEGPHEEWRYSSTVSLTLALDGVGGQRHALVALPPGKTRYPLYMRLRGLQGRPGRVWKISPPPVFDPRAVQRVASRYTD